MHSSYYYRNRRGGASATIAEARTRLSKWERRALDWEISFNSQVRNWSANCSHRRGKILFSALRLADLTIPLAARVARNDRTPAANYSLRFSLRVTCHHPGTRRRDETEIIAMNLNESGAHRSEKFNNRALTNASWDSANSTRLSRPAAFLSRESRIIATTADFFNEDWWTAVLISANVKGKGASWRRQNEVSPWETYREVSRFLSTRYNRFIAPTIVRSARSRWVNEYRSDLIRDPPTARVPTIVQDLSWDSGLEWPWGQITDKFRLIAMRAREMKEVYVK